MKPLSNGSGKAEKTLRGINMSNVVSKKEGKYHFIAFPSQKEQTIFGDELIDHGRSRKNPGSLKPTHYEVKLKGETVGEVDSYNWSYSEPAGFFFV